LVKARLKIFSKNDGDVDVKAFTDIEEAMAFRRVVCVDNLQVTGRALDMITFQCPWLVEVDFSGCKNVQAGLSNFANLASVQIINLQGCILIEGDVAVFQNNPKLQNLDASGTKVHGKRQRE
jgi:hypothetical protein